MIWFLLACTQTTPYNSLFDAPQASAILPVQEAGYWEQPLGFIANRRSGTIVPLDLQHNTALSDQFSAPFLRPRGLALGRSREISAIHVDSPATDRITLYALDGRTQSLLIAPYITGMLPEPQVITPTYDAISFVDADSSGDSPTLSIEALHSGSTTSETWTITRDDRAGHWIVRGSQSGTQANPLYADEVYISDHEEIELSLSGRASDGDYFTFATQTQIQEYALDGHPMELFAWDENTLLITVLDTATSSSWLSIWDMRAQQEIGRWHAPENVQLGDIARIDDTLWIADLASAQLFSVALDPVTPESSTYSTIPALGPVSAIEALVTDTYSHLFVASEQRVDVWDVLNSQWKQINPSEAFRGGIDLNSPIVGIAGSQRAIDLKTTTSWLSPKRDHVLVTTLFNGSVVMLEGETGCVATIPGGASLSLDGTNYGQIQFNDTGPTSNPEVYTGDNGMMLSTNNCGGLLLDEDWTVTFDGRSGDWLVEGSRSGEQETRAHLDRRYLSDNAAFSFLLVSGGLPPTDGDSFTFSTLSNLLELSLVTNASGKTESLEIPAAPRTFIDWPDSSGGWDESVPEQYALIPITNTNVVIRLNLETWIVEHVWN